MHSHSNHLILNGLIVLTCYLLYAINYSIGNIINNNISINTEKNIDKLDNIRQISGYQNQTIQTGRNINFLNYQNDNSITKYLNQNIALTDSKYIPQDLIEISNTNNIKINTQTIRYELKKKYLMRKQAREAFKLLSADFNNTFKVPIVINSSYRDYDYQKLISKKCDIHYCAREGHSEHQLGLALDLRDNEEYKFTNGEYKKYYQWLKNNAYKYGFHESYQSGANSLDWYQTEPWHWRYLGIDLAKYLYENKITLSKYYYDQILHNKSRNF